MCDGQGNDFLFICNGFKLLMHIESETSQSESVVKLVACFIAQLKVKESFKLLLAIKEKEHQTKLRRHFCKQAGCIVEYNLPN